MRSKRLHRRTLLRGAAGAAVALPVLECMLNDSGTALAQASDPLPKRYAIVFAGQALGGDDWSKEQSRINGQSLNQTGHHITPAQAGSGYTITTPLRPLRDLQGE